MIYMFLADGFEEIEALGTLDILRRCDLTVQTLSVTGRRVVTGAHGVIVKTDSLFRKNHLHTVEAIIIPGGLEGARTLASNTLLRNTLITHYQQGAVMAAICAGPMVLAGAGLLHHKHITCYPSLVSEMGDVHYHRECYSVRCGNIITGSGPAATRYFAFTIARMFAERNVIDNVAKDMLFPLEMQMQQSVLSYDVPNASLSGSGSADDFVASPM